MLINPNNYEGGVLQKSVLSSIETKTSKYSFQVLALNLQGFEIESFFNAKSAIQNLKSCLNRLFVQVRFMGKGQG